jgi:phospho-N-acetylmuramoyl-pentapeptide-transferase
MEAPILKILLPSVLAFVLGVLIAPLVTHYLYKYRVWKKEGGKTTLYGSSALEFNRLKGDGETKTPRMGGLIIFASVLLTVGFLGVGAWLFPDSFFGDVYFLSRSQTWIPLAVFAVGAIVGFLNDFYDVTREGRGLRLSTRLLFITVLAAAIGWWFYAKLGIVAINIPFDGALYLGILIIPFFIILAYALYAGGIIDGIDGLAGGVFAAIFTAYAGVAFLQQQYDIAALCATLSGAILAFLWFNIPPARFWMTETGSMALTLTLAVVAVMTDTLGGGYGIALLFIIGFPLVATVLSNILQLGYRRLFGGKLFRIAPLHHHFEAIGWPSYKVTMRYWLISLICALTGVILSTVLL